MNTLRETLNEELLKDIAYSLDRLKGNKEEYWRLLIPLLPKKTYPYNKVDVEKFAYVGISGKGSPALELLREFKRKGMELSFFKNMLQEIDCQRALDCFKTPTMPIIREKPAPVTVSVNEKLQLRCVANCIPEPPEYQWFYCAPNSTSPVPLKGKKTWRLVIDKAVMGNAGYYCCRVQNRRLREDKYAVFSDYAKVDVKDNTHTELEASVGSNHSIFPVQEVTDRTHETMKSQMPASISASYDEVTDGACSIPISKPVDSTDPVGPGHLINITVQPTSQTVKLKKTEEIFTLHCQAKAHGNQQLQYTWYYLKGGEKPENIDKTKKASRGTGPSIDITVTKTYGRKRRYFCDVSIVDQPLCHVASSEAVITLEPVWFVEQPKEKYVALTGSEVKLSCKAEAMLNTKVKYHWFSCQQNGNGKQPTKCFENEMTLPATIASRGFYVCSVTPANSDSIYSNVAHVEVVNSTEITVKPDGEPPSDRYMEFKDKLELTFNASCKHYPIRFQWHFNGKELPDCKESTLIIPSVAEENIGSYFCEASSDYSAKSLISRTCRVKWRGGGGVYTSLPTTKRQQIDAQEQLKIQKTFYAADKMALLIGNSAYKGRPLGCPRNDVEAMTDKFRQLNFRTISLVDLTLSQTAKAVEYFCSLLDKEMYAVFYFSGHGVEYNKTTYLMPIDADEPVRIEQCIDSEDFGEKMQKTLAKVIMIFDCCRVSLKEQTTSTKASSVQTTTNMSGGFSNICKVYACTPSLETYESKSGHYSYMTDALLQAVEKPESILQVLTLTQKYHSSYKLPPTVGTQFPTIQVVYQMKMLDDISFHDPILKPTKPRNNELLLDLPGKQCLEFTNPKLKNACGQVELKFSAKFSNVMIVRVVCSAALQPEVDGVGLKIELDCGIQKEGDKAITSFKISNLLDVVQYKDSELQISFQMPQDSSAKETLVYRIPADLIKPVFYHH